MADIAIVKDETSKEDEEMKKRRRGQGLDFGAWWRNAAFREYVRRLAEISVFGPDK